MPLARRRVTDAAALKALAHPLRMAILGALVTEGPMTATEAASMLEESPSNCSWHLRKLAEHGFVREARGGTGRNRPWQAVSEGLEWDSESPDEADRLAADALTDMLVERELQRLRAAQASREHEPAEWREATGISQSALWLTAEEAREIKEELTRLLLSKAERSGHPELRPEGARLTSLVAWVVPSGPHRLPADRADAEERS
ncbi:MAG: helix-turn-helix transcriptional regulator [Nocardioidaceae bacterium]|nr:helix-turn-helix transcriptional regulator [Nocardioidaceae bacterium]NUS51214.1 helix-turn-helix transcriptional regulator [Nocardioidaceae bacterium]